MYRGKNPNGSHHYVVFFNRKEKQYNAVQLTHLYVEDPKRASQVKKGMLLKEKAAVRVVKALAVNGPEDLAQTAVYEDVCDAFLFDTKGRLPGGNGQQFDWNVLRFYTGRLPFLLSGGIGPEDAQRIRAFDVPGCIGIDLNSRFETAPGLKDVEALRTFIETIKQ